MALVLFLRLAQAFSPLSHPAPWSGAPPLKPTARASAPACALPRPPQDDPPAAAEEMVGRMRSTTTASRLESFGEGEPTDMAGPDPADRLMELVTGGSGAYSLLFSGVLVVALHALLAFGTLSGVLLDASIGAELGLPSEQVAFGNSLVFFGWIPGALVGGPVGDRIGRKAALISFALIASAGLCATGLAPVGAGWALLAARGVTGVGIGGFVAPCFALLVESNDPRRKGRASVTWTWGYVAGVVILCLLHYGSQTGLGVSWRTEEFVLGAWGFAFTLATQLLVAESPRYLLASGNTLEAMESARTIAQWNGVDLDALLSTDAALAPLRKAEEACILEQGCSSAASKVPSSDAIACEELMYIAAAEVCALPAEAQVDWTDLFGRERLRLTLTFGCMEVAYNMAFYVIIFSAGSISKQLLLNLVLLAAADLPGSTTAGFLSDSIGAKKTAVLFLASACVVLLTLAGYQEWLSTLMDPPVALVPPEVLTAVLSLVSKSLCSGAFTAIFLLFSECYPTKLRSAALGSGMMFGKLGAAAAAPLTTSVSLMTSLSVSGALLLAAAAGACTLPASSVHVDDETKAQ